MAKLKKTKSKLKKKMDQPKKRPEKRGPYKTKKRELTMDEKWLQNNLELCIVEMQLINQMNQFSINQNYNDYQSSLLFLHYYFNIQMTDEILKNIDKVSNDVNDHINGDGYKEYFANRDNLPVVVEDLVFPPAPDNKPQIYNGNYINDIFPVLNLNSQIYFHYPSFF